MTETNCKKGFIYKDEEYRVYKYLKEFEDLLKMDSNISKRTKERVLDKLDWLRGHINEVIHPTKPAHLRAEIMNKVLERLYVRSKSIRALNEKINKKRISRSWLARELHISKPFLFHFLRGTKKPLDLDDFINRANKLIDSQ